MKFHHQPPSVIRRSGGFFLNMLYTSRRYGDARRLTLLLESHLRLIHLILAYKQNSTSSSKPCLLEQELCPPVTGSPNSLDSSSKIDPVDVLASYVRERDVGSVVPLEAVRVLYALYSSLSSSQPSPTTFIGHLSGPEATVTSMVRIIQHPYDELSSRNAVWAFMSLAVDKQPALASLFATGQFHRPIQTSCKGKDEPVANPAGGTQSKPTSALDVALDIIVNGKDLLEVNVQLLASVLRLLDVVWQHALEHKGPSRISNRSMHPHRRNSAI
jgi:nuclear pore complex protein Nup188